MTAGFIMAWCPTPGSSSTSCGRPAASNALDMRKVFTGNTLVSARPCISNSGRDSAGASRISEQAS